MLEQQLAADVRMNQYGDGTAHIVGMWQYLLKQRTDFPKWLAERVSELPIGRNGEGTGDVDEITAEALNWLLKKLRALSR